MLDTRDPHEHNPDFVDVKECFRERIHLGLFARHSIAVASRVNTGAL